MSRMRWRAAVVAGLAALGLGACGGSGGYGGGSPTGPTGPTGLPDGFYITISNMAYSPLELHVPPGGTVTVLNRDTMPHSVTSEDAPEDYSPGGVDGVSFDTGEFAAGSRTFTLPGDAPLETSVPYYCRTHHGSMSTPTGRVVVDDSAQPGPAPQ
ncbi:MAG: plastocyanin/azurin family copper-binding protein [Anaeromyxobacter sp.]